MPNQGRGPYITYDADVMNVRSAAGDIIVQFDGTNRKAVVPSGSELETVGTLDAQGTNTLAAGSIERSDLAEEALVPHPVPIGTWFDDAGGPLAVAENAGGMNIGFGTNIIRIQGEVTDNETEVSVGYFEYQLPPQYVAGGDITVRLRSAIVKTGSPTNNGSTIDVEAYLQADAAVGSDLCATAAQTYAALDTWYNKDFSITATGLVPGSRLIFKVTSSIIDSEAGGGTMRWNCEPSMLLDIKG